MRLVNLTPHALTVMASDGNVRIFARGQTVARVETRREACAFPFILNGVEFPLHITTFGDIVGLPPRNGEDVFVVSALVRSHPSCEGRDDVVSPGELIRDSAGNVIGCNGFTR